VRRSDIVSGILLVLFGLVMIFIIVPQQIKSSGDYGLDPKFFPTVLLWLLVTMAVLLIATRLRTQTEPADEEPILDAWNWLFIGGFSVFLILIFVAIKTVGFVLAGSATIALLMFTIGFRHLRWIELVGVSVLAPLAVYFALYHIFSVQLPSGTVFP
jgi:hypothetical protein